MSGVRSGKDHSPSYDEVKNKTAALARRVSATLRKAGVPRASRYRQFGGREHEGFIVYTGFGTVAVLFSTREIGLAYHERCKDILRGAGFELGHEHRLDRWHDSGGFDVVTGIAGGGGS